jgi:UPF0755 protein
MPENMESRKQRSFRWWQWLAVAFALMCLCGLGGAMWVYWQLKPPVGTGEAVDIRVEPGESVSAVATNLERAGLIRNAFVFRLYVKYKAAGQTFQAGNYKLVQGTSIPGLISALSHGDVVNNAVTVTIPEGYTVVQIADKLAADGICGKSQFLSEVQTGSFDNLLLNDLPKSKTVKYRLEGYLFPDTYEFQRGESAHQVVEEMLANFTHHVDSAVTERMQARGLTLPQLLTEASLVEKEARVDKERPIIASVIQNRLQRHMKLQIDATLEYILGHKDVLTDKDTQVDDPYNTYRNAGLPPGPIANPGMASIQAVLNPAKTNYLYYVVKNDGSGQHFFAATYQEQLHNEALSRQNLKAHSH